MGTLRLGLDIPSTHYTYFDHNGDCSSDPISGSVVLTTHTEGEFLDLSELKVSFVLGLSCSTEDEIKQKEQFSNRISRLLSLNSQSNTVQTTRECSILEDLSLCLPTVPADSRVGHSPDEGVIYKIPFSLPIPANIPATTATELGSTSLMLLATAKRTDGSSFGFSQDIQIIRQRISEGDLIQHTRTYQPFRVIRNVTLSQNVDSNQKASIPLTAKISLQQPATPTSRSTEFKCMAVRGIRWRVEEVTKIFRKLEYSHPQEESLAECEPIEEASFSRELLHGYQQGYWGTADNPIIKDQLPQKDSTVEVSFDISIPNTVVPAPEVTLSCYDHDARLAYRLPPSLEHSTQERKMVTVEHQMKVDIIMSEDTFDARNKNLVARKAFEGISNGSFPLCLVDRAPDVDTMNLHANPPCYTELPASPPSYTPIL